MSCGSSGNCTAGYYFDSSGNVQGLLLSQTTSQATATALVSSANLSVSGQAIT